MTRQQKAGKLLSNLGCPANCTDSLGHPTPLTPMEERTHRSALTLPSPAAHSPLLVPLLYAAIEVSIIIWCFHKPDLLHATLSWLRSTKMYRFSAAESCVGWVPERRAHSAGLSWQWLWSGTLANQRAEVDVLRKLRVVGYLIRCATAVAR